MKYALQLENKNLLIVNAKGQLKSIFCPFRVISILDLGELPRGTRLFVEEVLSRNNNLFYMINLKFYPYSYFHII